MLLILDNTSEPTQIAPLVPGTDRHRVLITSRNRLTDLDARLLDLDVLKPEAAAELVGRSLRLSDADDDRAATEPDAVAGLAALCGHHPLALRIAVGMLRKRRYRGIASLVDELRDAEDRSGALGVRPVFEVAYGQLPPDQARLLRLVCMAPTAEFSGEAAGALAGLEVERTVGLLEELAASHLVTPVPTEGDVRWRVHDLVRVFGTGVTAADAGLREEGEQARERLLGFCHRWAKAADERLLWLPGRPEPERFADRPQAWAWLHGERATLVAAVQWAGEERFADLAGRLAVRLMRYLEWWRHLDDGILVARVGLEVAQRSGHRAREARAWNQLGMILRSADRTEEAIEACVRSRALYEEVGDVNGVAHAWDDLANGLGKAGRAEEAIEAYAHALAIYQKIGNRQGEGWSSNHLGATLQDMGRIEEAIEAHVRARDLFQAVGDRNREGLAWCNLGTALNRAGRSDEAIEAYGHALVIHRGFEDWHRVAVVHRNLAITHELHHRPAEARTQYLRAADAYARADVPAEAANCQSAADSLT